MTAPRRVMVAGAGTVNPLGLDLAQTFRAMAAGQGAIAPVQLEDGDRLVAPLAAVVRDWSGAAHFAPDQRAMLDRATEFALVSARQAVTAARLTSEDLGRRCGIILGTAAGGHGTWDDCYRAVFRDGKARVHPFTVPRLMTSAPVSQIAIAHGIRGPAFTVSSACSSANHAIGLGYQMIRSGALDRVLVGGSEAMVNFGGLKAWEGLRVMSQSGCRPFCASRDGMVLGEGAAVLVLEAEDSLRARGGPALAELAGFAMGSDAVSMVQPDLEGQIRVLREVLEEARLAPREVGYVNAHGTGTALNDRIEAAALQAVFGGTGGPAVSSTKGMHGHLIGAAGAVEALACLLALQEGVLAPNVGLQQPDPALAPIDIITAPGRRAVVRAALSSSFAFGGLNAILAFRALGPAWAPA